MIFEDFFACATGSHPYPYQATLAKAAHMPTLLKIPTGAGKTESAVLGWLYRRFQHPDQAVRDSTPRRLVYCLPMRTLIEQTVDRTEPWLKNLNMAGEVGVVTLMGGEPRDQWYLEPEKTLIIVGTQDMLLSRALNRGYGNSPFMWPVEYGLLNNDCLWVMDEVQLMANGLPTSTQLAGLRRKLGAYGPSHSMWMSATVRPDWLKTIDHPDDAQILELGHEDMASPNLSKRHNARKIVSQKSVAGNRQQYARNMASLIAEEHEQGSLTLVIVNTVARSQDIYKALNSSRQVKLEAEKVLVHSRFRADDRRQKNDAVTADVDTSGPGVVVVTTQAIEAGVDISAMTLITELAPWASMVQRFGRCNREGKLDQANVFWVDVGERRQDTAPYEPDDVSPARAQLRSLEGQSVGPADIEQLGDVIEDVVHDTVIRRRDVVGLFDTTPDLSGSYLDVSQYVRGGDERDVSVFWRKIPEGNPSVTEPKPQHSEMVSVPISGIADYLKKDDKRRLWSWDFLDDQWRQVRAREIYSGMTLMLDDALGGYSAKVGWDPAINTRLDLDDVDGQAEDSQNSDPNSTGQRRWVTLSEHSRLVESEVKTILDLASPWLTNPDVRRAVSWAALYHDVGKAHCAFQDMMRQALPEGENSPDPNVYMAKSPGNGKNSRRHFRHELGSALAVMSDSGDLTDTVRDLAAYLAASHHGKVRLGIRSLPGPRARNTDSNPDPNYLLGYLVNDVESLPSVYLGDGLRTDETELDMSIARIGVDENGQRSWLDRTLGLLDWLGPFRLAYLEAIVRAADMRASKMERETTQ